MAAHGVKRAAERGAAMMVTMIIIAALLSGASVLVSLQLGSNRATDLTRSGMANGYCAEVGIERAAPVVVANYAQWSAALCGSADESTCVPASPSNEAAIFASINHDVDGDGIPDFVLYLRDDDDDPGTVQNRGSDNNLQVYLVATCLDNPDTPRQIKQLVTFNGAGTCYGAQLGNCQGNGNRN
jgi:hypothetical protein